MKIVHARVQTIVQTVVLTTVLIPAIVFAQKPLGIGRAATPDEIKKIDIDVMPDGRGLPDGKASRVTALMASEAPPIGWSIATPARTGISRPTRSW
jgi:hypothetical protein